MTTPKDWIESFEHFKDLDSLRFAIRFVKFQREWIDTQAGQLDELIRNLEAQEKKLVKQK